MNQFNIEVDWPNSLVHSLHSSRALNLTADRFQTNNTLIYSHGLSTIAVCEQSLFSSDFGSGVHARASGEARNGKNEGGSPSSPVSHLQSREWSFECLARFARRTKTRERLLLVQCNHTKF